MTVLQTVALPLGYEAGRGHSNSENAIGREYRCQLTSRAVAAKRRFTAAPMPRTVHRISAARDFNFFPNSFIRRLHSSRATVNPAAVEFPFRR